MKRLQPISIISDPMPTYLVDEELKRVERLWSFAQHHLESVELGRELFEHKFAVIEAAGIDDPHVRNFVAEFALLNLVSRSAVTATDLAAAVLARFVDSSSSIGKRDADVGWWSDKRNAQLRALLKDKFPGQYRWLSDLEPDPKWKRLSELRNIMTHREMGSTQVLYAGTLELNLRTGEEISHPHLDPGSHLRVEVNGVDFDTGDLIAESDEWSRDQFEKFIASFN